MMSDDTGNKIKALFFIALLAGAEAHTSQQQALFSRTAPSSFEVSANGVDLTTFQEQTKLVAQQMEALQTNANFHQQTKPFAEQVDMVLGNPSFDQHAQRLAEQVKAMMHEPSFQEQAKRFAASPERADEQFEAMMSDPSLKHIAKEMKAMQADPTFQLHAKHIAEQVESIQSNPRFQEQAERVAEETEKMNSDPNAREQAERVAEQVKRTAEQMENMKAFPHLQEQAKRAAEQVLSVITDPTFEATAKHLNDELVAMKANPNSKQHEEGIVKQMGALKANPKFAEYATRFAEQVQKLKEDPTLQEHAMRAAKQMQAVLDNEQEATLAQEQMEAEVLAEEAEAMTANPQDDVVESFIDNLVDKLSGRAEPASPDQSEDLETATLGKAAQLGAARGKVSTQAQLKSGLRVGPVRAPWLPSQNSLGSLAGGLGRSQQQQQQLLPAPGPTLVAQAGSSGSASSSSSSGGLVVRGAAAAPNKIAEMADVFCNLFAIWLTIAAVAAVKVPATFMWIPDVAFTGLLGLLMFSVGITTTIDDFKDCIKKPGAVAVNFFACYGIMPAVAYATAIAMKAEPAILAGLVLVGSINGGQASNLCTLIAGGDVALSVLMTTSTTLGCIIMTPLICQFILGAVVPVNAMGIVYSTLQVVLAPIFLGVGVNTLAPKFAQGVAPYTPVIGVVSTVLLVGAAVAKVAPFILGAGLPLQFACLTLHLVGGILGYLASQLLGLDVRTCRTVAIETAMKSSAFGFLLASQHFGVFAVRVPSAVSVVWMAITGSLMAVYWKFKPPPPLAPVSSEKED